MEHAAGAFPFTVHQHANKFTIGKSLLRALQVTQRMLCPLPLAYGGNILTVFCHSMSDPTTQLVTLKLMHTLFSRK